MGGSTTVEELEERSSLERPRGLVVGTLPYRVSSESESASFDLHRKGVGTSRDERRQILHPDGRRVLDGSGTGWVVVVGRIGIPKRGNDQSSRGVKRRSRGVREAGGRSGGSEGRARYIVYGVTGRTTVDQVRGVPSVSLNF